MTIEPAAITPRSPVPHRERGAGLVLASALLFSTSGVLGKPVMLAGVSPEQAATLRIGIAGLLLLAGTALFAPRALKVRRGEWPTLLVYGLLGVAGTQLLYFIAASRIPVGIAILLDFTSPVLIALWVRLVRRTRLPRAMWGGIALAMAGLALVAQVWKGVGLDPAGLLAGLGAGVCSAGYFLLGERAVAGRDPLGLVTWGMVIGAAVVGVVAPPWTVPWPLLAATVPFGPWLPPIGLLVLGVVLFSTVFPYLLSISALRHLPAPVASVLGLAEPVLATVLAWALLSEALTWPQILGAVILLGGAAAVQATSKTVT
ncbi:EamA family transporter [Amycolatopsis sp. PS_44_ISF1]|uniref:EamA family transporter n=1 Tax=Amycolatopsis sp. PS_44_ISF1 TaxID=2974917 RepID=UPI0028DE99D5|nr:EamA family transporter [Amycolatopsis sp. PS_44_ISF1]MDT8914827.1 EamA family transporter [Amycolatopsis sp. PS_44_ISF1]